MKRGKKKKEKEPSSLLHSFLLEGRKKREKGKDIPTLGLREEKKGIGRGSSLFAASAFHPQKRKGRRKLGRLRDGRKEKKKKRRSEPGRDSQGSAIQKGTENVEPREVGNTRRRGGGILFGEGAREKGEKRQEDFGGGPLKRVLTDSRFSETEIKEKEGLLPIHPPH